MQNVKTESAICPWCAQGWQELSSAPLNGTPVLLLAPDGTVGIGYLTVSKYSGNVTGKAAWCEHERVFLGGHNPRDAAHWMPLPSTPDRIPKGEDAKQLRAKP